MKTIGTVLKLIEKAAERSRKSEDWKGMAATNRRERYYNWGGGVTVGEMQEVYRVEYDSTPLVGSTVKLYHYETLTCEIWLADMPQVLHVYGESRTDADSVNTFLSYFDIATRYTYKPVNGGFQEAN